MMRRRERELVKMTVHKSKLPLLLEDVERVGGYHYEVMSARFSVSFSRVCDEDGGDLLNVWLPRGTIDNMQRKIAFTELQERYWL